MKLTRSIQNTFEKFEFGRVPRHEVIDRIHKEVRFSFQYFALLGLAIIIAALGVIIDNSAIVIGSMILAPLLWPILGIALAITTNDDPLLRRSLVLLGISVGFAIIVSALISLISPFQEPTQEILSRISPTVLDLVIALASGAAAIIVITWPRLSSIIAGIAVAASVLPPLAVSGIGIGFADMQIFFGSLLLFATNLVAILFAGVLVFAFLGFYRGVTEASKHNLRVGLVSLTIFLILIVIPLAVILARIVYERDTNRIAKEVLNTNLTEISQDIVVESIAIPTTERRSNAIDIDAVLRVPSDVTIGLSAKNEIASELSDALEKDVNLDISIVSTLSVTTTTENDTEQEVIQRKVEDELLEQAKQFPLKVYVESATVRVHEGGCVDVTTTFAIPSNITFGDDELSQITSAIANKIDRVCNVRVNTIQYLQEQSAPEVSEDL